MNLRKIKTLKQLNNYINILKSVNYHVNRYQN